MELKGKVIDFLGDSITEGVGVSDKANNRYDNKMKALCGLSAVHNYGISGTRIAYQVRQSAGAPRFDLFFCGRAFDLDKSADVVIVYGGTNDYGHGDAPFGTPEDKTPSTYCGAVNFLISTLKNVHPKAKILIMTPSRREGDSNPSYGNKLPLKAYADVIRDSAARLGVYCPDLYNDLGINPNIPEEKTKYTADGLHLNDAGHEKLALFLRDFIAKI